MRPVFIVGAGMSKFGRSEISLVDLATLSALPCLLVFLFAQRQFIQGTVITGVKG